MGNVRPQPAAILVLTGPKIAPFDEDPAQLPTRHNELRRQLQDPRIALNAVHLAVARLAAVRPGEIVIATLNIDDLHERG